jgi:hypothetical protein
MKKYLVHGIWLVVAIVVGVGGFFYGRSTATTSRAGFAGGTGTFSSSTRRLAGGTAGGGFATGQITAMDSSSITLQLANGNSEVVFYSSSTPVSEPTTVSPSTLKVGTNVMVGGTPNSDGSLTAQTIQVRAAGTAGGFGGGGGAKAGSNTGQ